jgi:EmrB/QacA subfamily drug resistance transporter
LLAGKQCTINAVVSVNEAAPSADPASAYPPPGQRRYLIFAVASAALFMASLDQTIVATALGTLQNDLHAQLNWSTWTITIYALGQILVMPLAGVLSDQYGRRRLFLIAIVVFTLASLCCGLSTNIYELVALRAVQAIGGGAFMPSVTGIVADQFGSDRDRAIGLFSSIFSMGAIVGPILGGVFVTYWSWRGIFLVNIPIGVALFVLSVIFIPDGARPPRRRIDLVGVGLMGAGLLGVMLAVTDLGSRSSSATSPSFLVPMVIGIAAIAAFGRHSGRAEHPFVPLRLLTGRDFAPMNVINFVYGAAVLGFTSLVPLYAMDRFHLRALSSGTLLTARAVGMISISAATVFLLRRTGYRLPMIVGFASAAIGTVLMSVVPGSVSAYTWLAVAAAITGLGNGIAMPAANNATLQLAPDSAAAISGLRGMFRQAGGITGVAIASAVVARSHDPGHALAILFVVLAAALVSMIPLVFLVPEHRGNW